MVVPSGQEQPEESPDQQELGPVVSGDRMTLVGPVASPVTSLPHTPGGDIVIAGNTEESPRTRERRVAAATLEQEMGRCSVAEAIRPIKERAVALSSSAEGAIPQEMVAEAWDTLVRERHPASPPVWPESSGIPAESQLARTREAGVLTEPPLPQRKSASTPRPQRDGSLRETERKPEPDTTTGGGIWTARMHNSTVRRVLDGLVSARATGHREPEGMNEILRDVHPRRGVLPVPGPARGSPRAGGTFPETGDRGTAESASGISNGIILCRVRKIESGMAAAPTRDDGKDDSTICFG